MAGCRAQAKKLDLRLVFSTHWVLLTVKRSTSFDAFGILATLHIAGCTSERDKTWALGIDIQCTYGVTWVMGPLSLKRLIAEQNSQNLRH